jgi:hypothetical protein
MFGFITDLTRSLTASLIHIDNLLLKVKPNNNLYDEVRLANDQITQALMHLLKLREITLIQDDLRENGKNTYICNFKDELIELITVIKCLNDLNYNCMDDKQLVDKITLVNNSMQKLLRFIKNSRNRLRHETRDGIRDARDRPPGHPGGDPGCRPQ